MKETMPMRLLTIFKGQSQQIELHEEQLALTAGQDETIYVCRIY
jgi:hypothetical protein